DFRLLLPAMAAWAATAAAILLRGPWVAVAAAGLALGLATVLGTSRVRSYLRWRRVLRAAGWNLVAAAVIASLAAAGTALQVNRVDSHPMMRELSASESGGQQGESNKGETASPQRGRSHRRRWGSGPQWRQPEGPCAHHWAGRAAAFYQ